MALVKINGCAAWILAHTNDQARHGDCCMGIGHT